MSMDVIQPCVHGAEPLYPALICYPDVAVKECGERAATTVVGGDEARGISSCRHNNPLNVFGGKHSKHAKALLGALTSADSEYLAVLLSNGVSPNLRILKPGALCWTTALHAAIEVMSVKMVRTLLDHGADIDIVDDQGMSPIDVASRLKDQGIVKCLIDAGCSIMKEDTRIICLGIAFHHLTHGIMGGLVLYPMIKSLLDCGLVRGWNGINDSASYVNRVYKRDRQVFGLLLQAAHDVGDSGFISSTHHILIRRRDQKAIHFLNNHGYVTPVNEYKRTYRLSGTDGSRHSILVVKKTGLNLNSGQVIPCPLQALCRLSIRCHMRTLPGKISKRVEQLELPISLKRYLDFLILPT